VADRPLVAQKLYAKFGKTINLDEDPEE